MQIYCDEIRKSSYVNTKGIKSPAPNSISHAVWPQGSHHNEFLQGALPFPVLWKLLLLWTLRLHHLLPAFWRALNVPIKTTKLLSEAHHLGIDKSQQVGILNVIYCCEAAKITSNNTIQACVHSYLNCAPR